MSAGLESSNDLSRLHRPGGPWLSRTELGWPWSLGVHAAGPPVPRAIDRRPAAAAPPRCRALPSVALALEARAMLPAIWFIFSRRECDLAARHLEIHGAALTSPEGKKRRPPVPSRLAGYPAGWLANWLAAASGGISVRCGAWLRIGRGVVSSVAALTTLPAHVAPLDHPPVLWLIRLAPSTCLPTLPPRRAAADTVGAGCAGGGAARGGQGRVCGGAASGGGLAPRRLPARLEGPGGAAVPERWGHCWKLERAGAGQCRARGGVAACQAGRGGPQLPRLAAAPVILVHSSDVWRVACSVATGLLKLVFATETLAAGINMPARTTLVAALSRRRGGGIGSLQHNELLQMAGGPGGLVQPGAGSLPWRASRTCPASLPPA